MVESKKYRVVFVSNFLNHHQLSLSQALNEKTGGKYLFIATTPTHTEQKNLGYHEMNDKYDFVLKAYESKENHEKAEQCAFDADVVIYGGVGRELLNKRLRKNKLTFKYFERLYKIEPKWYKKPYMFVKQFFANTIHSNLYLLCAGAYVADDYARTKTFLGKAYKWGYFPEVKKYESVDGLIEKKKTNTLLWAGRMIDWKHPEFAVKVARRLKSEGYNFVLNMIGIGEKHEEIENLIKEQGLCECVHLLGSMSPEKVREHMEESEIFMFTSDRQEGWGAVLNESMNSGCAIVADRMIGAAPYLIKDGENGLMYDGSADELYEKVKYLIDNEQVRKEYGKNAYQTMINEWNAETAAQRLLNLAEELKNNKKCTLYKTGPCSVAEVHKRKK